MRNQETQQVTFSNLNHEVREKLNITWTQYVLLDMVYHLSAKYGFCYMSKTTLAKRLGVTLNAVKYQVEQLTARELLVNDTRGLVCGAAYIEIAYTREYVTPSQTAKIAQTAKSDSYRGEKLQKLQSTAKTSVYIHSNTITTRKKRDDARKIIDYWNKTFSTNIKHLDKRINDIVNRMKTFTPHEICIAINNASHDPFFLGNGKNGWVGNLDYLVHNDVNLDKYLNMVVKTGSTYA